MINKKPNLSVSHNLSMSLLLGKHESLSPVSIEHNANMNFDYLFGGIYALCTIQLGFALIEIGKIQHILYISVIDVDNKTSVQLIILDGVTQKALCIL